MVSLRLSGFFGAACRAGLLAVLTLACAGRSAGPGAAKALGGGNPGSTGLDRHDFLYCGEWQKNLPGESLFLVKGGKVVWTHSIDDSEELGDCWMLSNGNILFSRKQRGATEIKPDLASGKGGEIVWDYPGGKGIEVHTAQPIGNDRVLILENGTPPRLMIFRKPSVTPEQVWNPEIRSDVNVHGQFRRARFTEKGTLLVSHMSLGKVVEYDQNWNVIWQYTNARSVWAAVRLKNGNTLISGNQHGWLREVNPQGQTVWELKDGDLPVKLYNVQEATRLANGNTLINNWCGNGIRDVAQWPTSVQLLEVTPDKRIVWQVQSWQTPNLGPASSTQLLDEPGVPEEPGSLQR